MSVFSIKDRVAVVTGAAQGLGRALCERLLREGCKVVLGDIQEDVVQNTAREITEEFGGAAIGVKVDVTKEEDCENLIQRAIAEFGRVDIAVSNAAILIAEEITVADAAKWAKVIEVNLIGYFNFAKHAAKVMKEAGKGTIIQINSKSGKKGSYKNSAYAAGKFGGIGLTQSIALDLAEFGVRVNSICPGNMLDSPLWVNSLYKQYAKKLGITEAEVRQRYIDQVPMKRGCTYDDVANVLVFMASDASSYMTGQGINVTGGQEMK